MLLFVLLVEHVELETKIKYEIHYTKFITTQDEGSFVKQPDGQNDLVLQDTFLQ